MTACLNWGAWERCTWQPRLRKSTCMNAFPSLCGITRPRWLELAHFQSTPVAAEWSMLLMIQLPVDKEGGCLHFIREVSDVTKDEALLDNERVWHGVRSSHSRSAVMFPHHTASVHNKAFFLTHFYGKLTPPGIQSIISVGSRNLSREKPMVHSPWPHCDVKGLISYFSEVKYSFICICSSTSEKHGLGTMSKGKWPVLNFYFLINLNCTLGQEWVFL